MVIWCKVCYIQFTLASRMFTGTRRWDIVNHQIVVWRVITPNTSDYKFFSFLQIRVKALLIDFSVPHASHQKLTLSSDVKIPTLSGGLLFHFTEQTNPWTNKALSLKGGELRWRHSPCCLSLHSRCPEPWQPHNAHEGCSSLTKETPH